MVSMFTCLLINVSPTENKHNQYSLNKVYYIMLAKARVWVAPTLYGMMKGLRGIGSRAQPAQFKDRSELIQVFIEQWVLMQKRH